MRTAGLRVEHIEVLDAVATGAGRRPISFETARFATGDAIAAARAGVAGGACTGAGTPLKWPGRRASGLAGLDRPVLGFSPPRPTRMHASA